MSTPTDGLTTPTHLNFHPALRTRGHLLSQLTKQRLPDLVEVGSIKSALDVIALIPAIRRSENSARRCHGQCLERST